MQETARKILFSPCLDVFDQEPTSDDSVQSEARTADLGEVGETNKRRS